MTIQSNDDELEQNYFQSIRRGSDRSVGYSLASIVLLFLFSVFFVGMYRTQSISDQIAGEQFRPSVHDEAPEIGDSPSNK